MALPVLRGRAAYIFAEPNFDVDRIVGFEALRSHDPAAVRRALMADLDPQFAATVRPGDILIGGRNFGYGHPHGPPMAAMRAVGVRAVIAESFAPLYLMGEMAAGFPQLACPGILDAVDRWDELEVDWNSAAVRHLRTGRLLMFTPLSAHSKGLVEAGGLLAALRASRSNPLNISDGSSLVDVGPRFGRGA